MKNKASRKKRRILLSLLMILFTGGVLSTSTYAWFTANKTVSVSTIDVTVASANGLQVSVDGANWRTVIANADITGATATYGDAVNQLPALTSALSPISTAGTVDATGKMEMFAGAIESDSEGNYILTSTKSTETNGTTGKFIAFDLFFQVNETTQVYLTSNSKVIAKDDPTGIQNAARVAFVPLGTAATGSTVESIQALHANTNPAIIWEPNNDVHTTAAIANASSNYGITTTATEAARINYYGVKSEITVADAVRLNSTSTTYFTAITPTITTTTAGIPTTAYQPVFTLSAGTTKMRVYMWVEGQDVDCENNASGGSISNILEFSVLSQASA